MSCYVNIYARLDPKKYRLERMDGEKEGDNVVWLDSFSRSTYIFSAMTEEVNPPFCDGKGGYGKLDADGLGACIDKLKGQIGTYREMQEDKERNRKEYIAYLTAKEGTLDYGEFMEKMPDPAEGVDDEIEELEDAISILSFYHRMARDAALGTSSFSELLCDMG